jgi:threonine dehydrogenase-like Zn-dependent dehydrogenase
MRALRLEAPGRLAEARLAVPQPEPDELLVRTVATTICTSDLNDIAHNPFGIASPRVLGHEGAGVVAAVGAQTSGFSVGDPVAAHPVIPCRACMNCRRGLGHLCLQMGHLGLDRDGTFAEFFRIRADRARRLPRGIDVGCACLLEPVAVCLEAVERGRVARGDTVLVVGDGPFGILIARLAAKRARTRVIVVGRHPFRLQHVPEATLVHEPTTPDVAHAIAQQSGGDGVDVAILAAGSASALELGLRSLRARGRLVVFSAIHGPAQPDWFRIHTQELELLGACNDADLIDPALDCLSDPALRVGSLVTHRIPFEQWPRAFDLARHGKDEVLKVALTFDTTP